MAVDRTPGRTSSPNGRRLSLASLAALSAALSAPCAPALGADTPGDVVQRMQDRLYFVERLKRGAEPMLAAVGELVGPSGATGDEELRKVRDRLKGIVLERLPTGPGPGEERRLAILSELAAEAVSPELRNKSRGDAVNLRLERCKRFEDARDDSRALAEAERAQELQPDDRRVYEPFVRIGNREVDKFLAEGDYTRAFDMLDAWKTKLPDSEAARDARQQFTARHAQILATTGLLHLQWLVPASGATVGGVVDDLRGGDLVLRPAQEGPKPPVRRLADLKQDLRVPSGRYEVVIRTKQGEHSQGTVDVPTDSGTKSLKVVSIAPKEMVLVPAGQKHGPFLIDAYEVTEGAWNGGPGAGGDRRPHVNVSFDAAVAWAKRFGRTLPTEAQWKIAACWDPGTGAMRTYPWGSERPQGGVHWSGPSLSDRRDAGSVPRGVSAVGCHDMAGNVSEWVRDAQFLGGEIVGEGFIGGSYAGDSLEVPILTEGGVVTATFNKLLDPAPSERVFRAGERTNKRFQKQYDKYHEDPEVTGPTIGFRCVIELKEE